MLPRQSSTDARVPRFSFFQGRRKRTTAGGRRRAFLLKRRFPDKSVGVDEGACVAADKQMMRPGAVR